MRVQPLMIHFKLALTAAAALSLAACSDNTPVAEQAEGNDFAPAPVEADGSAPEPSTNDALPEADAASGPIPAALRGRWGLTPADCQAQAGTPTGLLVITADQLRFYETVAEPGAGIEADADSISGNWTLQGEGMTEQRFQSLTLRDGKLVRSENGPASSFTYVRCNGA